MMEQGWRVYVMKNAWLWYLLIVPMVVPGIHVLVCWIWKRPLGSFDLDFCITLYVHVFLCLLGYQYWLDMSRETKNALMAHDETVDLV
jgi:hypothetical protein